MNNLLEISNKNNNNNNNKKKKKREIRCKNWDQLGPILEDN